MFPGIIVKSVLNFSVLFDTTWWHLQRPDFQVRSHWQVRWGHLHIFWGVTDEPITRGFRGWLLLASGPVAWPSEVLHQLRAPPARRGSLPPGWVFYFLTSSLSPWHAVVHVVMRVGSLRCDAGSKSQLCDFKLSKEHEEDAPNHGLSKRKSLGKVFNFSEPQFPHQWNRNGTIPAPKRSGRWNGT